MILIFLIFYCDILLCICWIYQQKGYKDGFKIKIKKLYFLMSYKKYELSKSLDNKKSCSLLIKIVIK